VNYNGVADTVRCVESLLGIDSPPHVVVVDSGSTEEGTVERLSQIAGITFIASHENLGFGRATNKGIRWALGNLDFEFVLLLNNDATVKTDTLSYLERMLDKNDSAGIACPRIVFADNPTVLWYGGGSMNYGRGSVMAPGYLGPADSPQAMLDGDTEFASGCAMLIRRSVLEQVGGFDPRFFMYEEDVELCLRIRRAGWKIWYTPEAIVEHRVQGSLRQNGERYIDRFSVHNPHLEFYLYHTVLNRLLTMSVHARGLNVLRFWTGFPIYWCARLTIYAIHRRWTALAAVTNSVRAYLSARKQPFVDELQGAQRESGTDNRAVEPFCGT